MEGVLSSDSNGRISLVGIYLKGMEGFLSWGSIQTAWKDLSEGDGGGFSRLWHSIQSGWKGGWHWRGVNLLDRPLSESHMHVRGTQTAD